MLLTSGLQYAQWYQLATTALGGLVCLAVWPEGLSGVLLGGLVMLLNAAAGAFLATQLMGGSQPKALYAALFGSKLLLLMAAVGAIMWLVKPHVGAFALGLLTFFVGTTVALGRASWYARRPTADDSQGRRQTTT